MTIPRMLAVAVAAALAGSLLWAAPAMAQTGAEAGPGQRSDARSMTPENQAGVLLQRLGHGAARAGATGRRGEWARSTGRARPGLRSRTGIATESQAERLRQQLRTGGGSLDLGETLPQVSADLASPVPGLAPPQGFSSSSPTTAWKQAIPGQDSPFTSSGNAAGYRPYPALPGVKRP